MKKRDLQPASAFKQFAKINEIPHPSKREGKMIEYLKEFGKGHQLETSANETGNVIIRKPATKGYEDRATVILQSHMDMVCDKLVGVEFDFDKGAIRTYVDSEWLTAKDTTFGADDGIGVVVELAVLESDDIGHGPVERVLIVDERTQLTGALGMKAGFMTGDYLINLDSGDEGRIYVNCAGGRNTIATFDYKEKEAPRGHFFMQISLEGLVGGHSGDDVNKKRANAIKVSTRFLFNEQEEFGLCLTSFNNGKLYNAIPRNGKVVSAVPNGVKEQMRANRNVFQHNVMQGFHVTDTDTVFNMENAEPQRVLPKDVSSKLILALQAVDSGVFAMCQDGLLASMIETSSNVAAVKIMDGKIEILSSQCSNVMSSLDNMCNTVKAACQLAGVKVKQTDSYPARNMNPDSKLVKLMVDAYKKLFNKESEVLDIHTSLECSLLSERYPHIDMVSFGPTLHFVHTPDERLHIPTVQMVWDHLLGMLKNVPMRK